MHCPSNNGISCTVADKDFAKTRGGGPKIFSLLCTTIFPICDLQTGITDHSCSTIEAHTNSLALFF